MRALGSLQALIIKCEIREMTPCLYSLGSSSTTSTNVLYSCFTFLPFSLHFLVLLFLTFSQLSDHVTSTRFLFPPFCFPFFPLFPAFPPSSFSRSFFSHVEWLMQGLVHLSNTVLVRRKQAKGGSLKAKKQLFHFIPMVNGEDGNTRARQARRTKLSL